MKGKIRDIRQCKGCIGINIDIRTEDFEPLDMRFEVEITQKAPPKE